jgi:membrane protease YdiL (CAAX protease family)
MANRKHLTVSLTRDELLWGWLYLAFEFLFLPTILQLVSFSLFPGISDAEFNFLYYFVNFLATLLIFHSFLSRNLDVAKGKFLQVVLYVLLGLVIYWTSNLVMSELTYRIMPDFFNVNDAGITAMSQEAFLLMAIGTVLLVPVAEESLFRGLLFRGIYGKSRWAAYAVSALCFCLPHVSVYIGSYELPLLAMCFVQYLPAGLMLAWSYENSNTILTPIIIHTIINAIGIYSMR